MREVSLPAVVYGADGKLRLGEVGEDDDSINQGHALQTAPPEHL